LQPFKSVKKKIGEQGRSGFLGLETVGLDPFAEVFDEKNSYFIESFPVLGSFREGFFDPLTGKLRRIPLEIVRVNKASGVSKLSYAVGFTDLTSSTASMGDSKSTKPLLSFSIPGLVGLNHPDRDVNGASSEFFILQNTTIPADNVALLDGQYAPFGYIVDGYELYQSLKPNDMIDATYVSEWGQQNLVKLRTGFSDAVQGDEEA
jgi:cyclophilin family peptidyl-prolyl cis-trans isomerase